MKIGIFTDPHYSSQDVTCKVRYNNQSLRKIEEAMRYFTQDGCELVIMLGDLTDTEPSREKEADNMRKIAALLDQFSVDTICLMGNHDANVFTEEEFYDLLGQRYRPRTIRSEDVTLLFLDANYSKDGTRYQPGNVDWTNTFYPFTQALEETLSSLSGSVYTFMHQNIDPEIREDHRLANDAQLRDILEQSGKVRAAYQGHYHWGHETEHGGVRYITLSAMCENEHDYRVVELD